MGLVVGLGGRTSSMTMKHFWLFFYFSIFSILLLVGEYIYCSMNFRFVRNVDLWGTDLISGLLSISLCYFSLKKSMKQALKEEIPLYAVLAVFFTLSFSLCCFLRLNLQIANGLLDNSIPEAKIVMVAHKESSAFGGDIKEGLSSIAYFIYFSDWDDKNKNCELLVPFTFYYSVGPGISVELAVQKGFFHIPWIEDYRVIYP
jgi:hypothetical protein